MADIYEEVIEYHEAMEGAIAAITDMMDDMGDYHENLPESVENPADVPDDIIEIIEDMLDSNEDFYMVSEEETTNTIEESSFEYITDTHEDIADRPEDYNLIPPTPKDLQVSQTMLLPMLLVPSFRVVKVMVEMNKPVMGQY